MAIEDAGFEIRDQIMWLYGSGFPKSLSIDKAIDKAAGVEREVIGKVTNHDIRGTSFIDKVGRVELDITAPATDDAKKWAGWGTVLKPANEPICVARKPIEAKLTIAANVLKHGTGGLNIDASRIAPTPDYGRSAANAKGTVNAHDGFEGKSFKIAERDGEYASPLGRWPANVIFDEAAAESLGGPSRFFYCAKASKSERNAGLEGEVKQKQGARPNSADASGKFPDHDHRETGGNNHPTVKPIKLMEYLIKLVTPPNGIVLDPFMGSGSTGIAAQKLGFDFIGIEMNEEYFSIANKRIDSSQELKNC